MTFNLMQAINQKDGSKLNNPVNVSVSKDQRFLAVTNSGNGLITIYEIDPDLHIANPIPIASLQSEEQLLHGIRFSPDGNFYQF